MRSGVLIGVLICAFTARESLGLENGLARTPPMGWLSWERFRCNTECDLYPEECISDRLFREMADRMVDDGYLAAGYEYLVIDDCWLAPDRDENGRLQPDPARFPNGIKDLSDYIHSKGLKFGIYEDIGSKTCAGYPGLEGHYEEDAQTLADWGVDYVKIDGCFFDPYAMDQAYPEFGQKLLDTKRPILYSSNWAVSQYQVGIEVNLTLLGQHTNMWRNWYDIDDSWARVIYTIDYFADHQELFAPYAGPGHWNDPDMLIIGNYALSYEQSKTQMAIWSMLAAPLIMSHDLRHVLPEFRDILLNNDVIQVNQDPLGIQGKRVYSLNDIEVWTREISPVVKGLNSHAVAVLNKRTDGTPYNLTIPLDQIGINNQDALIFTELFHVVQPFEVAPNSSLSVRVPPSGVQLFKAQVKENRKNL